MPLVALAWCMIASLFLVSFAVSLNNYVKDKRLPQEDSADRPPIIRKMVCDGFLILGSINFVFDQVPSWLRLISSVSISYSILFGYFTNYKLLFGQDLPILRSRLFQITTGISLIMMLLDYLRGDNTAPFVGSAPFAPTPSYYLYYGLGICTAGWLSHSVMGLFIASIYQHRQKDLSYTIRRHFGLYAFICIRAFAIIAGVSLLSTIVGGDALRQELNYALSILPPLIGLFMLIYQLPQTHFDALVPLVKPYFAWRQRQHQAAKRYLIEELATIVTGIRYRPDELGDKRVDIEIAQARYVMSTHRPRVKPITPEDEVRHILECRQQGITYTMIGHAIPQQTRDPVEQHNLAVARQLRRHSWWSARSNKAKTA